MAAVAWRQLGEPERQGLIPRAGRQRAAACVSTAGGNAVASPTGTILEPGQVWQSDWHRRLPGQHELCPDAAGVQLARQLHAHWRYADCLQARAITSSATPQAGRCAAPAVRRGPLASPDAAAAPPMKRRAGAANLGYYQPNNRQRSTRPRVPKHGPHSREYSGAANAWRSRLEP